MLRQSYKGLVWLVVFSCWQVQAMDNPRQPISDLENQIEELALRQGPFSAELIEPVMTLAKLYLKEYEFESATDQLQRAQNIAHRNEGVYTPRQFEAITLLTEIALNKADYRAADIQQKFAFFVQSHHLDPQDPEILFAYSEMAAWYMFTGQTRRARRLLKDGIEKATSLGVDPLPLAIELSRARRLEGICCVSKQLLGLVERRSNTDPDTLANAYLELADTYILARKDEIATEYFLKANEVSPLSVSVDPRPISTKRTVSDPRAQQAKIYHVEKDMFSRRRLTQSTHEEIIEDLTVEPQWFIVDGKTAHRGFIVPDGNSNISQGREIHELVGNPILFSEDQLNNMIPRRLKKMKEELRIELSFTVTHKGDLEDIEVKNSTAPVKLDRLVISALKKAYYRPALADGVPVTKKNVQLVQTFSSHYKGM
jgi:TonB family protein